MRGSLARDDPQGPVDHQSDDLSGQRRRLLGDLDVCGHGGRAVDHHGAGAQRCHPKRLSSVEHYKNEVVLSRDHHRSILLVTSPLAGSTPRQVHS